MKIYFLATSLFVSTALFSAENSPYEAEHYQARGVNNSNKQLLDLLEGKQPTIAGIKKAKVKHGFGATFDFVTPLRQGEGKSDNVYKKRLKTLKKIIKPFTTFRDEPSNEGVLGNDFLQLQKFYDSWRTFKLTHSAGYLNSIGISGFIAVRDESEIFHEYNYPEGVIFKPKKNVNYPLFYITDPDALSLLFDLEKKRNIPQSQLCRYVVKKLIELLRSSDQNAQKERMLKYFLFRKSKTEITELAKARLDTNSQFDETIRSQCHTEDDYNKIKGVLNNLPQFLRIIDTRKKAFAFKNYKKYTITNTEFKSDPEYEKIEQELQKIIPIFDQLQTEYTMISERITRELKPNRLAKRINLNLKHYEPSLENSFEKNDFIDLHCKKDLVEREFKAPIHYHSRVLRWFNSKFIQNKKTSSILYHSLLPLHYDITIIENGQHYSRVNSSRENQIDDSYQIKGKVTFDSGEESLYVFEICLTKAGLCYHRGCKKITPEELSEYHQLYLSHDDSYIEDAENEQYKNDVSENTAITLRQSPESIVLRNNMHACTIVLCKENNTEH